MSKEERQAYEDYIDTKRYNKGIFETALYEERKKIKQLDRELQEKDSQLQEKNSQLQEKDSQLQEKDNKLQQLAKMLLANGFSKEQIFKQTGIKL